MDICIEEQRLSDWSHGGKTERWLQQDWVSVSEEKRV
jgi:hypothetical protein